MNNGYVPPFTVSTEAINLIGEISALTERFVIRMEQEDALRLRKANRIKTIHSSLAIEGNRLSETQVRDIIDGKPVVAPIKEIQEVKNAIETYKLYPTLDAFKEKDLLRAHGVMMQALIDAPGRYRTGGVGVFGQLGLVHLAPPAERVPILMADLFGWLRKAKDHLLIRSCVFHYEFEFIHPFIDGNGRTGRLWQSLILGKFNPVFEHLPVENMVYSNQQQYYDAITASTKAGESGPFIDFMLREIYNTLLAHKGEPIMEDVGNVPNKIPNKVPNKVPDKLKKDFPQTPMAAWDVLNALLDNPHATSVSIAEALDISDRMVRKHLSMLKGQGIIRRVGPNKGGRWEVVS